MESFFSRYRNILVLLAILLAQIVGLAVQVRRTGDGRSTLAPQDGPGVRLIRLWAQDLVAPPEWVIHSAKLGTIGLWQNYLDLRHVREQNQDLQKTVDRLHLEQASLLEDARQGQRLQTLLGFQQKYIYTTLPAQAIGSSGSDQSRVFYLDKGSNDGLKPDMAVITADGIVGKVRDVFPRTAQVLMINDQTSGAGVILETTRTRGILRGNAIGRLQIVGIMADQRIQPGEKVFTAGGDLIFPRGLPVGVVDKVVRDPDSDSFIDVVVKPYAHLDRLDEVLVITSIEPRFSPEMQQDLATSEELKGAEAEAIKQQQKASEIMSERLPGLTNPAAPAAKPAAAQPGQAQGQQATPAAPAQPQAPRLMPALHPDRYSPKTAQPASESRPESKPEPKPELKSGQQTAPHAARPALTKPAVTKPAKASPEQTEKRRNP
jgi:rod shape-determining protein MreC